MERQNDFAFEYEATMKRLYVFFSDLLDKELAVKNNSDNQSVDVHTEDK